MALTENNFTAEEFSAAITANPDLIPIIKGTLTNNKYVVQDEAEHTTFKTTFENEVATRMTAKHAEQLEADVLKLTGIPKKDANEKYYDYYLRATGEKLNAVNALQTELDALKAGAKPSDIDKARILELEKAIEDGNKKYTTDLSEKDKTINDIKLNGAFGVGLAKIQKTYKAGLPESLVKMSEESVISKLKNIAKIQEDGTITFLKEDGTPELNKSTFKAVTVDEKLAELLGDIVDPGRKVAGTGTEKDKEKKLSEAGFTGLPADVDSQLKLSIYLKSIGILQGSDEFDKIFAEHGENLKLR